MNFADVDAACSRKTLFSLSMLGAKSIDEVFSDLVMINRQCYDSFHCMISKMLITASA